MPTVVNISAEAIGKSVGLVGHLSGKIFTWTFSIQYVGLILFFFIYVFVNFIFLEFGPLAGQKKLRIFLRFSDILDYMTTD